MRATMEKIIDNNELDKREAKFVLNIVKGDNKSEAARNAGYPETSAGQRGSEMSQKPEIQQAIQALKDKVGNVADIDVKELVNTTLINMAMDNTTADRDKLQAVQLLGKTQKMFVDVQETTSKDIDDADLLDEIEISFGKEARDKAAVELGQ